MAKRNGSPNYVEFPFDKEVVLTLREDRGALRSNHMGDYFLRHFQDDLFSCCSPDLERRILDSGARTGSVVAITKEKYGRSAIWNVKLLGASQNHQNGHANGHAAAVDHAWRDLPSEKYSAPNGNGSTPHTLEDQLRASIEHVKAAAPTTDSQLNLMARCGCAAVDAALAVQAYAASKGLPLKFNEQSISAWSSTMYINAKNGDR